MDDLLQPKLKVNQRLLECDFGHNRKHMENTLRTFEAEYALCASDIANRISFRTERKPVCRYCLNKECMQEELAQNTSGTDLNKVRRFIGYLKLYDMFRHEDFLLVNPDNEALCKEAEEKIKFLEEEIRERFSVHYLLYRDLFSYQPKKCGGIEMSPYTVRIALMELLVRTFPKYYESLHIKYKTIANIYAACTAAKDGIPNFYKILYATIQDQDWNIYFDGLHPRMISSLVNRFNESDKNAMEIFFSRMGLSADDVFEKMDMYEVKNMDYFKKNSVSKSVLERYKGSKVRKRYPVVYKFVKGELGL